jgi:uncharacterized protein (TIGR02246 family)
VQLRVRLRWAADGAVAASVEHQAEGQFGWDDALESSLEDERRARDVLHGYCRAIDMHDEDALRDLMTEDVAFVTGTWSCKGVDAVSRRLSAVFQQRKWARHFITNTMVRSTPDALVLVRSYFQFVLAGETRTTGFGEYSATMHRAGDQLLLGKLEVAITDTTTSS